jgi:DNA segregation ATPase FtsK/SpoIIIE-like protein
MLFDELGARGVGIASLLSMGHQQSRGAIGFFLGFKLASWWERAAASNEVRMVLSLDAVNPVFESLAQTKPGDDRKKADLLLISAKQLDNGHVTVSFAPVEIKNHAANTEPHHFPATSSKIVKNALDQLKNSQKLIKDVIEVMEPQPRPTLLNSTMATILEIGVSLGAGKNRDLSLFRAILAAVASGACEYAHLPAALFWFERFGLGHADAPFLVRKPTSVDRRAKLFIDPERWYREIAAGSGGKIAEEFVKIYGSAAGSTPAQEADLKEEPSLTVATSEHDLEPPSQPETAENEPLSPPEVTTAREVSVEEQTFRPRIGKVSVGELETRYDKIIETLDQFRVSVLKPSHVDHYTEGPASITFRVQPEQGIRVKQIEAEVDSLKLALELDRDQNINTDINQGCVEIDVPKKDDERYFVDAGDLWDAWERPPNALEVPVGVDQLNQPVSINFSSSNSPHLLIGGTTGSGKSEALNTLLYGLTEHYSPQELRLLLVDPKGTELVGFEESPFLDADIGWDGQSAIEILDAAVEEMQKRYSQFRDARARSLPEFNEKAAEGDQLPWWLIVLDEYADLIADADEKKKIEHYLRRLAQKARAAGIHVIIATQKPSVDVINTVLRSNLPAQLALKVRSATESRVIMNESGAETLNGKGDAFLRAEGKLIRLQCALYKQ